MNRPLRTLLFLALAMPLASACDATPSGNAAREAERESAGTVEVLGVEMDNVAREVRRELDVGNIRFGGNRADNGQSDEEGAHITPSGGLLIEGKSVDVTPQQRELLLDYRGQVAEIAMAGARVGLQGASLATKAMGEAFRSVFSGETGEMEKRIEAEARKIEAEAVKICDELRPLYDLQQRIAAEIPALGPYATMTLEDVDDCRTNDDVDIDVNMMDAAAEAEAGADAGTPD